MAKGYVIPLSGEESRVRACQLVAKAPSGHVCQVSPPTRSNDQNAKLWAMLSDVAQAMPEGRRHTPDDWKAIFMNACGWEVAFTEGLDGRPFPLGFRSSKMSVTQMRDLIEFILAYGDQHGVRWSESDGNPKGGDAGSIHDSAARKGSPRGGPHDT